MGRKTYTAEQIIGKLREAEVLLSQGFPVLIDSTPRCTYFNFDRTASPFHFSEEEATSAWNRHAIL